MSMGQQSAAWPRIRASSSKASMAGYENTTRACNSLRVSGAMCCHAAMNIVHGWYSC
jgi:hypothetical protein